MASNISKFEGILRALPDAIRSAYRRVVPNTEEEILANIMANSDVVAKNPLGFTLNPRTGEVLQPKVDYGYMMATIPEQPDLNRLAVSPENLDAEALGRLVSDPYFMDELTRGAYFGGWYDDSTGEFVLDPSRRFLSKDMSIIAGMPAQQKAGFDLKAFKQYNLDNDVYTDALRRLIARSIAGGAATGTGLGIMQGRE